MLGTDKMSTEDQHQPEGVGVLVHTKRPDSALRFSFDQSHTYRCNAMPQAREVFEAYGR